MASDDKFDTELSEFFTRLWNMDNFFCIPTIDYDIDIHEYVKSTHVGKYFAGKKFFMWVDEEIFDVETYKTFQALLENYEIEVGIIEDETEEEYQENIAFLTAVMKTGIMQAAHSFLESRELAPKDSKQFRQLLYDLWFRKYKRNHDSGDRDSSGFEHVFVGETRDNLVMGLHNWIQFYLQTQAGNIDYKGYFQQGTEDEEQPRMVTLQFNWHGDSAKPIGSTFIGKSPEFEFAVYTVAFLVDRGSKLYVRISDYEVELNINRVGRHIGTCYPNLLE